MYREWGGFLYRSEVIKWVSVGMLKTSSQILLEIEFFELYYRVNPITFLYRGSYIQEMNSFRNTKTV